MKSTVIKSTNTESSCSLLNCKIWLRSTGWLVVTAFLIAGLNQSVRAQSYALSNIWSSVASTTGNRDIAYSAESNEVFAASTAPGISVYDGSAGTSIGSMSFSGLTVSGTQDLNQMGVAYDGVIYGANLTTAVSGSSVYRIYRWPSWNAAGYNAYSGDPTTGSAVDGKRIGDSFAITGSGTNTLMIAGLATINSFVLFSTLDGTNFTPTVVTNITGLPTISGEFGLQFYTNNTFIVKPNGSSSIYLVQYPAGFATNAGVSGTLLSSSPLANPSNASTTALLAYNPALPYLGVNFLGSSGSSQQFYVRLYNFDFTNGAGLLVSTNLTAASNGNLTGGLAVGQYGTNNFIYALNSANNLQAYQVLVIPPQPPTITTQPVGGAVYPPDTLSVSVLGTAPFSYQWLATNAADAGSFTNIPGATTNTYLVTSVSTNYYEVIITNSVGSITSSVVLVATLPAVTNSAVSTLWTVAPGNSQYPYLPTTGDATRGIAYDANSQKVVVSSSSGLYILNGNTGATNGSLSLSGATFGGAFSGPDQVGIADDGAVYAGNLTTDGQSGNFNLFRWSTPANGGVITPGNASGGAAFAGDPGAINGGSTADRWGDYLAVRGAGAGTEILLASKGTNVALLVTADGTNFTSLLIGVAGVPSGFAAQGIAFGAGNTLWAKSYGSPGDLWEISFDTNALVGTVVYDYKSPSQISGGIAGLGIDPVNNILAGVDLSDTPNDLQLFQLTGDSDSPVLFNQSFFASANANGNDNAAVVVKYPRAYALDVNNGVVALTYGVPATTAPTITTPPASITAYADVSSVTFSVSASGSVPLYYQWQFNSNDIPGATSSSYTITNPPLSSAGYYDVVVHNIAGSVTSAPPTSLTLQIPTTSSVVTQLWTLAPGSIPEISDFDSSSYNTRGLAYDTNTATVLLADHNEIYLLSATDGSYLGDLNMLGVPDSGLNGWLVDQIGVADDGVLYSCNLALTGPGFSIIQWDSISPGASGTAYAYGGSSGADPGNGSGDRWGDTLSVRGAGLNTQILIGSYTGTNVLLFTTTDGSDFTPTLIAITNVPAGFAGLGIAFGAGNTLWAEGGSVYNLRQVAFDPVNGVGGAIQSFNAGTQVPENLTGLSLDVTNNILAAVNFNDVPNDMQLYLVSGNSNAPALFNQSFFGANNANGQQNAVTVLKGGLGFGLDVNNGLTAISYGTPSAPSVTLTSVAYAPGGVTISWNNLFTGHSYQVQYKNNLLNPTWTDLGAPVTTTNATASYVDTTLTGSTRFYRVVSER